MKKSLLAIAAMTAFAGAAQAQSSVTVYGVMDAGIASISNGVGSSSSTNNQTTGLQDGGLSSPRIGFKGMEDLGGGTKANFLLESELSLRNGGNNGIGTNGAAASATASAALGTQQFSRGAWVGLSNGQMGEFRLGYQNGIAYDNSLEFDALKGANMGGYVNVVSTNAIASGSGNIYKNRIADRLASSYAYITPTFYGFSAKLVQGSTTITGPNDGIAAAGRDTEVGLRYEGHGAKVAYNYATLASTNGAAITQGSVAGTNAWGVYAAYDFKILEVNATHTNTKGQGTGGNNFATTGVGVRAPITPVITVGVQDTMVNNSAVTNANANVLGGVVEYAMSKRTTLYVLGAVSSNQTAGQTSMTSTSKFSASTQVGAAGLSQTGYMLGMRHTF
jgi:predicted porin